MYAGGYCFHYVIVVYMGTVEERFWSKVIKTNTCWMWIGTKKDSGYGVFWDKKKLVRAHRFSYETNISKIPPGLVVDHKCHNRSCVRPDHLQAVTIMENNENRLIESPNSKTGVRGVYFNQEINKYEACAKHKGKKYRAGYFESIEDAKQAVIDLRNKLHTNNLKDRA